MNKERRDSLDVDEKDMQRLLGDSFSLSEGSLQNAVRQKSPQQVKKVLEQLSRPESHMVWFTEHSVSSEMDHSEIQSLDNLFPVAAALDSDDTLSERSVASDGFKLNVMTLDDLAPIPFETAEISQEKKETPTRTEDSNKKSSNNISKVASPTTHRKTPRLPYESNFEREIPSEMPQSTSEISERLTDKNKNASLISEAQHSTYKSQDGDDDDHTLSQSSSSSHQSDSSLKSSSSIATVTHGPSPDRRVKEVAVQTQAEALTYTWSSGLTAYSPAVFALNDILWQQLDLTRAFIDSTRHHYTSVIESLGPADYKYTTLEDTKEFIRTHRPPKLSIEDPLEEVLQEMRLSLQMINVLDASSIDYKQPKLFNHCS